MMSGRIKRKQRFDHRCSVDKVDQEILEATSEAFRIEVDKVFYTFISDETSKEYTFPTTLSNLERKYVHQKAMSHNLMSRSHGKEPDRAVNITKRGHKSNFESFYVNITPESVQEVERLIQVYQLEDTHRTVARLCCTDKVFGKLSLGAPPVVPEPKITPYMRTFQEQLPIFDMKQEIVAKIRTSRVVIISSETGSGKTTQIPQYIMDDARLRGEKCRILCTQPRRISTVSVAERVAHERGSALGENVGYHIRLESKLGTNCNLIYCTNGVLIRSLMSGNSVLSSLTHIIIDEVHERDKLSDFLLICLRESLRKGIKIKLILMSATINVEKFQAYFEGAAVLSIPGRLYSIKQFYLDDVIELTGFDRVIQQERNLFNENSVFVPEEHNVVFDNAIRTCMSTAGFENEQAWTQLLQFLMADSMTINYRDPDTGFTPLMIAVYQENIDMVEKLCNLGADPLIPAKNGTTAMNIAESKNLNEIVLIFTMITHGVLGENIPRREDILTQYYKSYTDEDINYDLLIRLICTIHTQYHNGAILVFLPGYDDIMICNDRLMDTELDRSTYRVFFLHSSMNIREQHEVFKNLDSVRKIILSTNIAETSLTIDDVVYVIDSGKAKVQTYESYSGLSSLQTQWISKACVKQRAGRAGRTRSGLCFHLFSKTRYDSFLNERIPEILRVPLEELCLNTKTLAGRMSCIYDFLVKAPDPPHSITVKSAIENLECLGALDKDENLTPLGEYLSQLTIEPHLGKMLIYSVIFKCLDPILTIVASLAQKDPFQLPPQANLRTCATEKRNSLMANTYSDHIVYLKAFIKWQDSVKFRRERNFCRDFFISPSTMETILKTRAQLLGQLRAAKFVPANGSNINNLNLNSDNWPLVKAVIASGLYPKLAYKKAGHFCTRTDKKVVVSNANPISKVCLSLWLVYDELVRARNGHQLRGITPVTPVTISLMCGIKVSYPMDNYLNIDEWLEFEFPSNHVIFLRRCIETIIHKKLLSPTNVLTEKDEAALCALAKILIYEDRAVSLSIPTGIKHKPKFSDMNRALENQNEHRAARSENSSVPGNVANFFYNYSQRPRNGHLDNGEGSGSSGTNGYQSYSNGNSTAASTNGSQGSDSGSTGGYQMGPSNSRMYPVGFDAPSTSGAQALPQPALPNYENSIFLLIRVKLDSSIKIAYHSNKWVFSPQTEKQVMALDNGGANVYLVFTVPKMNTFYGIAKFASFDTTTDRISASIEWIFKSMVPYKKVSHLRNPLNSNRLIYDGLDGQIIEMSVALKLWDLFVENGRPIYGQPQ